VVVMKISKTAMSDLNLPESWTCVDCGINTGPGLLNRADMEKALTAARAIGKLTGKNEGVEQVFSHRSEIYTVRNAVWKAAGMEPFGGCLCVGCLEVRLGRRLEPRDFLPKHVFNNPNFPATDRLRDRRGNR